MEVRVLSSAPTTRDAADGEAVTRVVAEGVDMIEYHDPPGERRAERHSYELGIELLGANQASSAGLYSMVMLIRCAGQHRNSAVSLHVETGRMCEIPKRRIEPETRLLVS